ncbi:hypothetical protein ACHAWF_003949 [Thalassiosira exigua]
MSLVIVTSKEQLRHVSTAIMKGINDVWEEAEDKVVDIILTKKMKKGKAIWAMQKELLGFDFDGRPGEHTTWLAEKKRPALLLVLREWIRGAATKKKVPFKDFESVVEKIRHAFTSLPTGEGLITPLNDMVTLAPPTVFLHKNATLLMAVRDCCTLLSETMVLPTKCSQHWSRDGHTLLESKTPPGTASEESLSASVRNVSRLFFAWRVRWTSRVQSCQRRTCTARSPTPTWRWRACCCCSL